MKDLRIEQWLAKEGVAWHYEDNVPFSSVDRKASFNNQARFDALNEEHVIDLAIAAEQMELPAIVAYKKKDGKLVIIDGNHRMEAYSRLSDKVSTDFYIVDTVHTWVIDRLTRTANIINGVPLTREERMEHAIYLVRVENMEIASAAKCLQIPKSTLNMALNAQDVREKLGKLGFSDRLPFKSLTILNRIKQNKALLEAAQLVQEAKLTGEETRELATRIERAAVSEKAQKAAINEFRLKYQDKVALVKKGKITYKLTPGMRLNRALNVIHGIKRQSVMPLEATIVRKIERAIGVLEGLVGTE